MRGDGRSISLESVAWVTVLALAVSLRVFALAGTPLDADEAREALAAAAGTPQASAYWNTDLRPQATSALFHVATHALFLVGGAGNGAARAVPALAGIVPLAVLWWCRRRLGSAQALFLGGWIAVSPAWLAVARAAGDTSLALAAALAAAAAAWETTPQSPWLRKALLAITLGFGIASGPAFLMVIPGVALTWWLSRRLLRTGATSMAGGWKGRDVLEILLWSIAAAIASASGMGMIPSGVPVLFSGIRSWLTGWIQPGDLGVGTAILDFLAYEPLIFVLGILGAVGSLRRNDRGDRMLVLWSIVALVVFLVYPGRRSEDILWPLLPLGILAARAVQREIEASEHVGFPWAAVGLWAALALIAAFAHQQLSAYLSGIGPGAAVDLPELRLPIALGALGIAVVVTVLVGFGWDWATARSAAFGGVVSVLLVLTVSASWHLNLSGDRDLGAELWRPTQAATGITRLRQTLESLALSQTGERVLPIALKGAEAPAVLAWALRTFPVYVAQEATGGQAPPVVLQPEEIPLPRLPAQYLGQGVTLEHAWGWEGPWPPDFLRWWLRRSAPLVSQRWVLYVREDVATLTPPETDSLP
jgi:hypothetical protein